MTNLIGSFPASGKILQWNYDYRNVRCDVIFHWSFPLSSDIGRRTSVVGRRRTSDVGRRTLDVGRRSSVVGRRSSDVGRRSSVVGRRTSDVGRRSSTLLLSPLVPILGLPWQGGHVGPSLSLKVTGFKPY